MNLKANLNTLPLVQVQTHTTRFLRLEQVVSIGQRNILQPQLDLYMLAQKN